MLNFHIVKWLRGYKIRLIFHRLSPLIISKKASRKKNLHYIPIIPLWYPYKSPIVPLHWGHLPRSRQRLCSGGHGEAGRMARARLARCRAGDMSVETRNGGAAKSCGKNGDLMFFFFMKHDDLLVFTHVFPMNKWWFDGFLKWDNPVYKWSFYINHFNRKTIEPTMN